MYEELNRTNIRQNYLLIHSSSAAFFLIRVKLYSQMLVLYDKQNLEPQAEANSVAVLFPNQKSSNVKTLQDQVQRQ